VLPVALLLNVPALVLRMAQVALVRGAANSWNSIAQSVWGEVAHPVTNEAALAGKNYVHFHSLLFRGVHAVNALQLINRWCPKIVRSLAIIEPRENGKAAKAVHHQPMAFSLS